MDRSFRSRLPGIGLWIATAWASFFGLIVVLEAFAEDAGQVAEGDEWEAVAVGVLTVAAVLAVALSWWRREWLVPLMLAAGALGTAIALLTAGQNYWMAVLVAGGPYLLAAGLGWLGRRAR